MSEPLIVKLTEVIAGVIQREPDAARRIAKYIVAVVEEAASQAAEAVWRELAPADEAGGDLARARQETREAILDAFVQSVDSAGGTSWAQGEKPLD